MLNKQTSFALFAAIVFLLWTFRAKRFKDTTHVKEMIDNFHWLLGHFISVIDQIPRILEFVTERFEALGVETGWISLGSKPRLLTRDPQVVKHVMKDNFDNYEKGKFFSENAAEFLGKGIFVSDGARWRIQRKTASHLFTMSRLRDQMTLSFCESADLLIEKSEGLCQNGSSVDMYDMFNRLTLDAFVKIAFGYDLGCLEAAPETIPFMKAFDYCQEWTMIRMISPTWIWKLMRFFNVSWERKFKRSVAVLDGFIIRVLKERKQKGDPRQPDLLSLYIDEGKRYSWAPPTYQELKDIALNFVIAGRDTTAQTLTWVLYMLARRPDVYRNVMKEVASNQKLSWYNRVEKMSYTHAVISETLRLFPIVPSATKTAVKDDILPNGFKVPAGTMIMIVPWSMGRSTKIWGKDARRFKPERWIGNRIPPDHEFMSFNAGRRTCLGKKFAYLEIKIVLTKFLERFTFQLDDSRFCVGRVTLTLPSREGLHCFLEKREDDD